MLQKDGRQWGADGDNNDDNDNDDGDDNGVFVVVDKLNSIIEHLCIHYEFIVPWHISVVWTGMECLVSLFVCDYILVYVQ